MTPYDLLKEYDLGLSSAATGNPTYIDVHVEFFWSFLDGLVIRARGAQSKVYVLTSTGGWRHITGTVSKLFVRKPYRNGLVEIAIVDPNDHLVRRFTVSLWKKKGKLLEAVASKVPIKKLFSQCEPFEIESLRCSDVHCGAIDVVYTWVNSTDAGWRTLIEQFAADAVIDNDRFCQDDELRYSIRSLFTFAPWVRNVFIFTNCAPPEWFVESERIRWIMHHEVIPEKYLPLFNSHAIETFLHEIPGLSERYLYFNDDVFLAAPVSPTDFFTSYGQAVSRMEADGTTHYLRNVVTFENADGWQHAAVNASALLKDYTGIWPTRLHCHTPHAILKTLYHELTELFPDQLETTRQAKFRARTDFPITSFLYHHFAFSKGRAIPFYENAMVIRSTNFNRVIRKRDFKKSRFFCINDGGGSAGNVSFRKFKSSFLSRRFPFGSPAERVTGDVLQ